MQSHSLFYFLSASQIKICGCLCLGCAVLCVVVTVTTTVIHMNRLQTLRECVYQSGLATCTCFPVDFAGHAPSGVVFAGVSGCHVVHGVLYSCLRALFGVSVVGILVCIFSAMLVYQLLGHEKKKEYWAQLEARCRYLHHHHRPHSHLQHPHQEATLPMSISGTLSHCHCCTNTQQTNWASPPAGNLYSPNPTESTTVTNVAVASNPRAGSSSTLNSFRKSVEFELE